MLASLREDCLQPALTAGEKLVPVLQSYDEVIRMDTLARNKALKRHTVDSRLYLSGKDTKASFQAARKTRNALMTGTRAGTVN